MRAEYAVSISILLETAFGSSSILGIDLTGGGGLRRNGVGRAFIFRALQGRLLLDRGAGVENQVRERLNDLEELLHGRRLVFTTEAVNRWRPSVPLLTRAELPQIRLKNAKYFATLK